MKKLFNVKFVLLLAMLVSIAACDKDDDIVEATISECDATENKINPSQDIIFPMGCIVHWKDGSGASDLTVKMQIHKEYCEGNTAGNYEVYVPNRVTSMDGYWLSYYNATYTYKNKKDKVLVKFIIAPGAYDWTYDYVYRWEDVDEPGEYDVLVEITLPINEDGS